MVITTGNRLRDAQQYGQSIWLDELRRDLVSGSGLRQWVHDGVSGVTSNPTILAKAFAEDCSYRNAIAELRRSGADGREIYEHLSVEDVRHAADALRRTYDITVRRDGYVSIEVTPRLAHDIDGTVREALALFRRIDRPNVMIKTPLTDAGAVAMRRLIAAGVNVNATLVFSVQRYQQAAEAFMLGLEERVAANSRVDAVASVVSIFVSRIDSLIDARLDAIRHPAKTVRAEGVRGKAAIAIARSIYQEHKTLLASHRWQALAARHALPQRLLWASTSTKDARYSDVKYVNELIGDGAINTLPPNTLAAFCDHGAVAPTLESNLLEAAMLPGQLQALGIDLEEVGAQLQREGIDAFARSMESLLEQLNAA